MAEIRSVSIKQTGSVYTTTAKIGDDPDKQVDIVSVEIEDFTGGGGANSGKPIPSPSSIELPPKMDTASSNRQFQSTELTFLNGNGTKQTYTVTTTMLGPEDADGNRKVIGVSVESQVVVKTDASAYILSATIRQLNKTDFRLEIVTNDPHKTVKTIVTHFLPAKDPVLNKEPITLDDPIKTGKEYTFQYDTLRFLNPSLAVGAAYDVIIDLFDSNKDQIGVSEQSIVVQGL